MRYPFTLLLLVIACITARAQRLDVAITNWLGSGANTFTTGHSISTKDGGLLFTGYTNCFDGGGAIPANFHDSGSNGTNLVIARLDSNRHLDWAKVYGGTGGDLAADAVELVGGGYAVLASTSSTDRDVTDNHGGYDMWLLRLDAAGNLLWQKCYGGPNVEYGRSIVQTPDGGFVLLGISDGAGGEVPAHYLRTNPDDNLDWFMVRTDAAGNTQWTKTIGGTGGESWNAKLLLAQNGIYLAGSSSSYDHDLTDSITPGKGQYHNYLLKMDMTGNLLWTRRFGVPTVDAMVSALWDDRDSSIVISGMTVADDMERVENIWAVKTDANGITRWEKTVGDDQREMGRGIAIAPHGYMVAGTAKDDNFSRQGIWLSALDMDGNTLATKKLGGTGEDWPNSITSYRNGFAITGFSTSRGFAECANLGNIPDSAAAAFITEATFSPTAVPDVDPLTQQLTLIPNPTKIWSELTLPNNRGGIIQIYNNMGIAIYGWKVQAPTQHLRVDLYNDLKGIYIIKWTGNDGAVMTTKMVKE